MPSTPGSTASGKTALQTILPSGVDNKERTLGNLPTGVVDAIRPRSRASGPIVGQWELQLTRVGERHV